MWNSRWRYRATKSWKHENRCSHAVVSKYLPQLSDSSIFYSVYAQNAASTVVYLFFLLKLRNVWKWNKKNKKLYKSATLIRVEKEHHECIAPRQNSLIFHCFLCRWLGRIIWDPTWTDTSHVLAFQLSPETKQNCYSLHKKKIATCVDAAAGDVE